MFFTRSRILPSTCRNTRTGWTRELRSTVEQEELARGWSTSPSWTCQHGTLAMVTWELQAMVLIILDCQTYPTLATPTPGTRGTPPHSPQSPPTPHQPRSPRHLILSEDFLNKMDRWVGNSRNIFWSYPFNNFRTWRLALAWTHLCQPFAAMQTSRWFPTVKIINESSND